MKQSAVLLCIAVAGAFGSARADDGFTFEIMEPAVENAGAAALSKARELLDAERYEDAIAAFEEVRRDAGLAAVHADASYEMAKAWYRLGMYHVSLSGFAAILEQGPRHTHYESSREWLFFIARRMQDQRRVVSFIADRIDADDLPPEYASELHYQLARHYFLRAQEAEDQNEVVEELPAPPPDDASGEFDFGEEEMLGDDRLDFERAPVSPKVQPPPASAPSEEGDFEFDFDELGGGDDDGFSFDLGDVSTPRKSSKRKKVRSGAKKRVGADANSAARSAAPATSSAGRAGGVPEGSEANHKRALFHVERIDAGFSQFAKAQYLRGLIYFALDDFEKAVDAFQDVVRMTNPRGGSVDNPKLREMAFFSLARIHYQFEQFRYAIFYYERVSRDSEAWLDALFESAWSHFRLGDHEKALGNLITIQAPFFIDGYYPESHILKAITFYENCRYPEAQGFLDEYQAQYSGVMEALAAFIAANDTPEATWARIETLESQVRAAGAERSGAGAITARVLALVLQDKRLAVYRHGIDEVAAEHERLTRWRGEFLGSQTHTALLQELEARRVELIRAGGHLLRNKLKQELNVLRELGAKLIRIRFEVTKQEKEALAASLRGESLTVPLSDYRFNTATDDERVYWPFEGEYWRDELGTYEYTLTRGCRPSSPDEG